MKKAVKSTLMVAAGAVALASGAVTPSLVSAWGDNGGGRPSYTIDQIEKGVLGNKPVFNSISNSTIGNEKNFVAARVNTGVNAGINNVWSSNDITVKDGEEYIIRLYVHNNNPNGTSGTNSVSHNTRVSFDIPTESSTQVQVNGFIYSDNAIPNKYWDYVNFNSSQAFHLEYVYGSAIIENNGIGSQKGGYKLSDEIVTAHASKNGVQIGYDKLDGEVPGCYTYASYITIRVKAVFDSDYMIHNQVRIAGTKDWSETVEAKVGDKVEFQIHYKNTSETNQIQENVRLKDILPKSLKYVPGTITLYNTTHQSGLKTNGTGLFDSAVNIGSYGKNSNGYIRFMAEVLGDNLQCGSNTLVNWAQGGVGQKTIQDYASVTVHKTCDKPEEPTTPTTPELPTTGPTAIAGGAIAAGSIVTAAGYIIASRRSMR